MILAGIAFLLAAIGDYEYEAYFLRHAVQTTGQVTQLDEHVDRDSTSVTVTYAPVFTFQTGNVGHTVHSESGTNPPGYVLGQVVPIVYDPTDPDHAQISTFGQKWGLDVGFGVGGTAASIIGWVMFWVRTRIAKTRT